ncbi:Retrovirus-related Pol polyprotein from transposon TNT 1-94 [Trichinella patagoniensis]|uniref:Retrovirus-related Pol polyprotein from transposon TNT 1-94 n=1 Tax=Trichinella patagoniensis TaxID=990121 RepID=A0A0V0Z3R4_9BILA|nr:Retrovirus-related Pol polyprotein from transposon TNT 1-94 [Trichinella patagoniensis]
MKGVFVVECWHPNTFLILPACSLQDLLSQLKPCPAPEDWSRTECKAIGATSLTVGDDSLIHLAQLETAWEMWQTLQRLHERASIGSKLYLMRKLYGMRFTHGTMQSHINGINGTQLRGLGKNTEWDGPTWAQFYSHSGPLFIYWSLFSLFYYWSLTSLSY